MLVLFLAQTVYVRAYHPETVIFYRNMFFLLLNVWQKIAEIKTISFFFIIPSIDNGLCFCNTDVKALANHIFAGSHSSDRITTATDRDGRYSLNSFDVLRDRWIFGIIVWPIGIDFTTYTRRVLTRYRKRRLWKLRGIFTIVGVKLYIAPSYWPRMK